MLKSSAPVIVVVLVMPLAAGIGLDHARIDGRAFAADQPGFDAAFQHLLEDMPI